jgi:hypothetical protein
VHELLLAQVPEQAPDLDGAAVEGWLRNQRYLLKDEAQGVFLLCGDAAGTQYTRIRLLTEPEESLPPIVVVRILPREVHIAQRADVPALLQAKELAEWLVGSMGCRIMTPEGDDMTDRLDEEYAVLDSQAS